MRKGKLRKIKANAFIRLIGDYLDLLEDFTTAAKLKEIRNLMSVVEWLM